MAKNHYNSRTLNINLLELVIKKNKSLLLWVKSRGYFISGIEIKKKCEFASERYRITILSSCNTEFFCYDPLPLKQISFECVAMWNLDRCIWGKDEHIHSFPHLFFKDATHRASNHKCIPNLFTSFAQNFLKDFFLPSLRSACWTDVSNRCPSVDGLINFLSDLKGKENDISLDNTQNIEWI